MRDLKKMDKRYRLEIEGLRAVAILLVVVYHIWFGRVSGGIDVFFVLSGFLVTMTLLSRIEKYGRIRLFDFLVGLAKRLLPQALTVLAVTTVASLFFLQQSQWGQVKEHAVATFFYLENWRLAFDAVDYLAQGMQASPLQHFWSLSLQGQIYLIWPLLLGVSYIVFVKWCRLPLRKTMLAVFSNVFVLSLGYSIYKTNTNQPWAYFDTFARMWEFSVGGLLVLLLPYLAVKKWVSSLIGWFGLAVILLTGYVLQVSTAFPGYIALVPIGGAVLILISAENSARLGVKNFLSKRLFVGLGGISYGVYLWHWPLLRFYESYFYMPSVPVWHGVAIVTLTLVLAYMTTHWIEKPIRSMHHRVQAKKLFAALTTLMLGFSAAYIVFIQYGEHVKVQAQEEGYIPSLTEVKSDFPSFYYDKHCLAKGTVEVRKCSYGVTDSPDYIVALVGGSHSGHWFPALEILAEQLHFQIDVYNHDGCRFTNEDPRNYLTPECLDWNANLIEVLKQDLPDLVFTTSTLNMQDHVPPGYIGQWEQLEGLTTIFAVRDNPRMTEHAPECLEREKDAYACGVPRSEALSAVVPWENTEGLPSNVIYADLSNQFCDAQMCPAAMGQMIIYRDNNHLTATFAKTLAKPLKPHLQQAFESLKK